MLKEKEKRERENSRLPNSSTLKYSFQRDLWSVALSWSCLQTTHTAKIPPSYIFSLGSFCFLFRKPSQGYLLQCHLPPCPHHYKISAFKVIFDLLFRNFICIYNVFWLGPTPIPLSYSLPLPREALLLPNTVRSISTSTILNSLQRLIKVVCTCLDARWFPESLTVYQWLFPLWCYVLAIVIPLKNDKGP